ncbi:thermonuclease family protein [Paenibacillus oenotherae]|uniref:Thermonuclease family protein n=1 Tax=Paenibacillus oenotherae TaxID=1435645 RepID=A0ABS7D2W7_9BACL|nr:thermonuclease family protein [Paenibacillus oenotherae]MBW7474193.1 thermonuclease family protein [Paenibacillus oenotherae]
MDIKSNSRCLRMIMVIALLAVITIIAGCSTTTVAENDPLVHAIMQQYPELSGKKYELESVGRIVDGDTLVTESGHKIRLIGVNTPEVKGESRPLGLKASEYTASKLEGKRVILFPDTGDTDRYGRLLRYLFIEGEMVMFNEMLLRDGYASVMTIPPNVTYADRFVEMEQAARAAGTGLWGGGLNADQEAEPEDHAAGSNGQINEAAGSCSNPLIKGNIRGTTKIYHLPESRSYNQTKAEQMFCTEQDAEAAGFRKAK